MCGVSIHYYVMFYLDRQSGAGFFRHRVMTVSMIASERQMP